MDDDRLQRLENIEAARDLQARYADAVDGADMGALAAVFAPDAVLTAPGRRFEGREQVMDFYRAAAAADPSDRRHFITNVRVVAADATAVTLQAYFLYTAGTEGASILGWGRYVDEFSMVDGGLVMSAKDISIDWRGPVEASWSSLAP